MKMLLVVVFVCGRATALDAHHLHSRRESRRMTVTTWLSNPLHAARPPPKMGKLVGRVGTQSVIPRLDG